MTDDDGRSEAADLPDPLAPLTPTADEQAAFDAWTYHFERRVWPFIGLFLAGAALVWWPTDLWLFPGGSPARRGLTLLRAATVPLNLALPLVVPRLACLHRRPALTLAAIVAVEAAIAGAAVGIMGERWVGFLYLVPLFTTLIPVPPAPRAAAVSAVWGATWLGYAATADGPASDLIASAVLFSLFGVLMAMAIGHAAWAAMRAALVSRHRLATLAASLQARVDAQTADLREILAQVDRAREDERTLLARELHDELGQELSALRITTALGRRQPGPAIIEEIDRLLDRTGQTVRRMLLTLRPRALDELGLAGGLHWLGEQTERRGLPCAVSVPEGLVLSPQVEQALFRCAQEALTNVVRHARAQRAEVRVVVDGDTVRLEVDDDGLGLDADAGQRGLGLLGIRERARALGGQASWTSDGGTRLRVVAPMGGRP